MQWEVRWGQSRRRATISNDAGGRGVQRGRTIGSDAWCAESVRGGEREKHIGGGREIEIGEQSKCRLQIVGGAVWRLGRVRWEEK